MVVDPHHQYPERREVPDEKTDDTHGDEDRERQVSGRQAADPEDVRQQVPRAPPDTHDQSGREHTVTAPDLRNREPGPAEFLEDAGAQCHRQTDQHQARLVVDVTMPGRNVNETSESVNSVANHRSGAVSSATAYQRAPTRHLSSRDSKLAKPGPSLDEAGQQKAVTLGPASIARTA